MTWPPGLDLIGMLIEDHRRDHGGLTQLIPCIHEDLDADLDLLAAGARRCGGALFHLNATDEDWEAPPGPIAVDRRDVLAGVLAAAGGALPDVVLFEVRDGGVVARLSGPARPPEPSLNLILRAAAVVASSAYDELEIIVTAVSVASMDATRRELLWRILTLDPQDLNIRGTPTTLAPVIGASLDPELDYRRNPEMRYVVLCDRVIRRSSVDQTQAITAIADLGEQPLVIFLGAGASRSSGVPLGNAYRDLALRSVVGDHDSAQAAGEAFFDLVHDRRHVIAGEPVVRAEFAAQLTLERVLREIFIGLGYQPRIASPVIQEIIKDCSLALEYLRPGRLAIRDLAKRLKGRLVVITVNFDELVETDLGVDASVYFRPDHFKDNVSELARYVAGDASLPVPILKLHGSINDPDSLIASIDSTSAGLNDDVRNALNQMLDAASKPLRWVWVGCSMRDRDVNLWLGGLSADALDEWWVDPLPGQALDDFFAEHRAPKWGPRGRQLSDRLVLDSADGFLRALAARVSE